MLNIVEILTINFKLKANLDAKGNIESYEVSAYDKITNKLLYEINRADKAFWDLNLMLVRLYEEENLNDNQYEKLCKLIEFYGDEKYQLGCDDTRMTSEKINPN